MVKLGDRRTVHPATLDGYEKGKPRPLTGTVVYISTRRAGIVSSSSRSAHAASGYGRVFNLSRGKSRNEEREKPPGGVPAYRERAHEIIPRPA